MADDKTVKRIGANHLTIKIDNTVVATVIEKGSTACNPR